MNLERLRAVQAEEREADSLRPLPDTFYLEVADYLAELRDRRASAAESAPDPFSDETVRRLTDEIETAEEVVEAIYERRVGKLVKMASFAASAVPVDNEDGLTTEEADLFADLVAEIEAHRADVLASFEDGTAEVDPASAAPQVDHAGATPSEEPSPTEADELATEPGEAGSEPDPATDDSSTLTERITVRITEDIGEVFGVDERVYDLAREDVVTLPTANARPLLEQNAAEEIE